SVSEARAPFQPSNVRRRGDGDMKMISQETKCVDLPAKPTAGFAQRRLDRLRRARSGEQIAAIVPSVDDMVDCTGKLNSKPTRHVRYLARRRWNRHPSGPQNSRYRSTTPNM